MRTFAIASAVLLLLSGCDTIRNAPRPLAKTATLDLYVVSTIKIANSKTATDPDTNATVFLTTPAIITAADVATIQRSDDSPDSPSLTVNLTPTGATKLAAATAKPNGMQLAFVLNGTIVAVAKVFQPMSSGFCISGGAIMKDRESMFEALTKD